MIYTFWLGHEGEQLADEQDRAEFAALCEMLAPVIEEGDDG